MPDLPKWADEIRALYLSGAANQFILHGNVDDRILLVGDEDSSRSDTRLGNLTDLLVDKLLHKFDVVLTYELGAGVRVAAGDKTFRLWPSAKVLQAMPKKPAEAIGVLDHFLRYCVNLRQIKTADTDTDANDITSILPDDDQPMQVASGAADSLAGRNLSVALIFKSAQLILPMMPNALSYELSSLASVVRSWSRETHFIEQNLAVFLLTENLNDLHSLLANNPRAARIEITLPDADDLKVALKYLASRYPVSLERFADHLALPAQRLSGASLSSVESLLKRREHSAEPLAERDLADLKKRLVERDCQGLIEFIEPDRNLSDYFGQEPVKQWMRQDIVLWEQGDLGAMPMGYLLCGPVGTGKTYLVECLAGEAGVPVVKLKNFRDRWVGSTEGNLEKIFSLLHALGRCIVFIDEADQALGSRDSGSGDSGVSGRVYSMMAKEMSDPDNRGRILWILASSRPDLIEVDLKRPGRVDVKIPLFPTTDADEVYRLIRALCRKHKLDLPKQLSVELRAIMPGLVTPGAAESLAIKVYRQVRTQSVDALAALTDCLEDYQNPVPADVMQFQIDIAVRETSDLDFVPESFRTPTVVR